MADSTFTVKITGLERMQRSFNESPKIAEPIYQEAINKSADILASHTDPSNVPWKTGTLARSFNPVTIGKLFARWYPRVKYARAVQFGLPPSPGRYVPAIKRRLVHGANIGMWPGFKGRHYMEKIKSASTRQINDVFKVSLARVIEAIKKA